jgi:hypothetical protein
MHWSMRMRIGVRDLTRDPLVYAGGVVVALPVALGLHMARALAKGW